MNKDNDFKQIEALLAGRVRQPSPGFEEALRRIPLQQAPANVAPIWPGFLKLAGIAAAVALLAWSGLDISLSDRVPSAASILQEDADLLTLFSLSNDLDMAETLLSEENLLALDYLTSTP